MKRSRRRASSEPVPVSLEFSVEGLDALREKLEDAGDRYKHAYALALNDLSPQIINRVRAMLPVRTGKMRRGVRITRTVDGIAIAIPQYYRNQLTGRLKNLRLENLVSSIELETAIARHL